MPFVPHLVSCFEDIFTRTVNLSLICFTCAPPLLVYLNLCTSLCCPCIPALDLTSCGLFVLDLKTSEAVASVSPVLTHES